MIEKKDVDILDKTNALSVVNLYEIVVINHNEISFDKYLKLGYNKNLRSKSG